MSKDKGESVKVVESKVGVAFAPSDEASKGERYTGVVSFEEGKGSENWQNPRGVLADLAGRPRNESEGGTEDEQTAKNRIVESTVKAIGSDGSLQREFIFLSYADEGKFRIEFTDPPIDGKVGRSRLYQEDYQYEWPDRDRPPTNDRQGDRLDWARRFNTDDPAFIDKVRRDGDLTRVYARELVRERGGGGMLEQKNVLEAVPVAGTKGDWDLTCETHELVGTKSQPNSDGNLNDFEVTRHTTVPAIEATAQLIMAPNTPVASEAA